MAQSVKIIYTYIKINVTKKKQVLLPEIKKKNYAVN